MRDEGHEWTTQRIIRLEAKIRRVYEDALSAANDKYAEFTAKFRIKDEIHRAELKAGKITKADYRDWLKGQVFQRERLEAQIKDLAHTMTNANVLAAQFINDATPEAFAYNANWAAFAIEKAGNADMGFGLYDAATVKRMILEEPSLLPPSRVEIPKDELWNTKKIAAQINQGIILGEDLATIAKRFRAVTTANANMSLTHARTAMTGAQNAGRIETYRRAEKMGIKLEKEWLATLDSHTRDLHGKLDSQHVPVDDVFNVEGFKIRYPGDPTAHPAMVYNCRCTLISRLLDYPAQNAKRRDEDPERKPIKDMTFREWRKANGEEDSKTNARTNQEKKVAQTTKKTASQKKAANDVPTFATKKQLDAMPLEKLREETALLAAMWYETGPNGYSFPKDADYLKIARSLTFNASRTSLTKDYMSIKKKLEEIYEAKKKGGRSR